MTRAGAAGFHIEDQVMQKRCGHRPNKEIVSQEEMVDRVKAAVDARTDANFYIMARTDALQQQGLDAPLSGRKPVLKLEPMLFSPKLFTRLSSIRHLPNALSVPVLANITEFGQTPLFNTAELAGVGVKMVLYPLSAFRAMNKAALNVYQSILANGDQKAVVDSMQTRMELYDFLNYHSYEEKLDSLFAQGKNK